MSVVRKASFSTARCPIARSVAAIGDAWSLLIMREAISGTRRFGDFQRNLGLAKNILAARLKALVACDVLRMAPASDGSAYMEYVPTQRGYDLLIALVAIGQWGERWIPGSDREYAPFVERTTGARLAPLDLRSSVDGRKLGIGDLRRPSRDAAVSAAAQG